MTKQAAQSRPRRQAKRWSAQSSVRQAKENGRVRELPIAPPPALSPPPVNRLKGPRKAPAENFMEFPDPKVSHSHPHRAARIAKRKGGPHSPLCGRPKNTGGSGNSLSLLRPRYHRPQSIDSKGHGRLRQKTSRSSRIPRSPIASRTEQHASRSEKVVRTVLCAAGQGKREGPGTPHRSSARAITASSQ
jgi:hypothetical protein